jgi:hypothetical protein
MARARSVSEILSMRFEVFPFDGKWEKAFGCPERTGIWFVWGNTANGKTSFAMQLCKYLCQFEKVIYNSVEEGDRMTMQRTLRKFDMIEVNRRFTVTSESIVKLSKRLSARRSPNVAVVDSFQAAKFNYSKFRDLVEKHPNKLFIFISRAQGIHPRGKAAEEAVYDADLKIYVEGYRAFNNGRATGEDGFLDIWPEKAEPYWACNNYKRQTNR